jgi:glycine dehydrogenase subunit 2
MAELLGEEHLRAAPPALPEVAELDLVRHYTQLAHRQFSIDGNVYPLGSCTMKYNPKLHEEVAKRFQDVHPYQDEGSAQGVLTVLAELQDDLASITGMDTGEPAAGRGRARRARGHPDDPRVPRGARRGRAAPRGDLPRRRARHEPGHRLDGRLRRVEVPTGRDGEVDLDAFRAALGPHVAAVMLTNPNTLGLFETRILAIAEAAHAVGAQLYYDGANLNAIVGRARPGDMGFDVVHLNLHKTFTTPHGGGGPGTGPVGVKAHLAPYLPAPLLVRRDDGSVGAEGPRPTAIGRLRSHYGNVGNLVRAWAYIRTLGLEGLRRVSTMAVLNANYLRVRMREAGYRSRSTA